MGTPQCLLRKLSWIGYLTGTAGVGYFFWIHKAHVAQYIPYLLLVACPLMHLFGHGHHGQNHSKCSSKGENNA